MWLNCLLILHLDLFDQIQMLDLILEKLVLFRGPILYCLEEKDNGKYLNKFVIDSNNSLDEV